MAPDDSARPVWLLDVDGVLNAARPQWSAPSADGTAYYDHTAFRMRWAPALMAELGRLHRSDEVEFRWATTWVDNIQQIEQLMGLPRFPVAFAGLPESPQVRTPQLKVAAALQVVETEGRPLIWTDDDAIPAAGPQRDRLVSAGQAALLIVPDPQHGLRPDHLVAVGEFLADIEKARPD